jgi:hypothetical protein
MPADPLLSGLVTGYWVMVAVVTLRAGTKLPALLVRRAGHEWQLVAAGVMFALFVATAPATVRRARVRGAAAAAEFVWAMGIVGLALAGMLIWLI